MSDLVGNFEDMFSRDHAHLVLLSSLSVLSDTGIL